MTQQLLENTVREWVFSNPARGARELYRLAETQVLHSAQSAADIADALIQLAGRMELAENRLW